MSPARPPTTIGELLEELAARCPDAPALLAPERGELSYRALLSQVERTRAALLAAGVEAGGRVAILLPGGPDAASAFLGVAAGFAAAPLNPGYRRRELEFFLGDIEARAVITQPGHDGEIRPVAEALGIPVLEISPAERAGEFRLPTPEPAGGSPSQPEATSTALLLHTSGTTSRPKLVPLSHGNLLASAGNIRRTLGLTEADRCLNVMPLFHIHGLMAATMATLSAGGSLVCTPGFRSPRFFPWLREFRPTWYTAVPTMHQAILARSGKAEGSSARPELRFVRSSSASLPPSVLAELEETFGCPVVEAYGMTEASHQMTSNPLPPGERLPGSVGPAAGPEVAIMDEGGRLLGAGEVGEVVIRGENVTRGYLAAPEINAAAFTDGWFRTGDQGSLDGNGYLTLTGRLKELINRGGEKISPREIDEVLLEHPDVAQAVAFALPHPKLGEDVAAAVVLAEGAEGDERGLRDHVADRLSAFKVPARVVFVEKIPTGPSGKLQRIGLADALGLVDSGPTEAPSSSASGAVGGEQEATLLRLFRQVLEDEEIGPADAFLQAGGDSVLAVDLLDRIHGELGEGLTLLDLFEPDASPVQLAGRLPARSEAQQPACSAPVEVPPGALSPAEQAQWYLQAERPDDPAYNVVEAFLVRGELDLPGLSRALAAVAAGREGLRCGFELREGGPRRFVPPPVDEVLEVVDLTDVPAGQRMERALARARREVEAPFDLSAPPLWRFALYRLAPRENLLVLVAHHIVADGWSRELVRRDLSEAYRVGDSGGSPRRGTELRELLPALPRGPWPREEEYWIEELRGAPRNLDLPAEPLPPPGTGPPGGQVRRSLDPELVAHLEELGRREGCSLFMVLLAGLGGLLHRYAGVEDMVLGAASSGRLDPAHGDVVGLMVNPLALRIRPRKDLSFSELLAQVRNTVLGALAHRGMPFHQVVRAVATEERAGASPLFQILVAFENIPRHPLSLGDTEIERVPFPRAAPTHELDLVIHPDEDELRLELDFRRGRFRASRMRRLLDHLVHLLQAATAAPERPLGELPLVEEAQRRRLLEQWNATASDYPREATLPDLFREVAAATPEATALSWLDGRLTYRDLEQEAETLARALVDRGVAPGDVVALHGAREPGSIVGMLGVLMAGAAYLPLDPDEAPPRRAHLIAEVGAEVLVSAGGVRPPGTEGLHLVAPRAPGTTPGTERPAGVPSAPDAPAYVMYTSGSTGSPKGVVVPHRAVIRLVRDTDYLDFGPHQVIAQASSLAFDASTFEIWGALLNGGRLALIPREVTLQAGALRSRLAAEGVRSLFLTTSLFDQLTREDPTLLAGLDTVLTGGETLDPGRIAEVLSCGPPRRLLNVYGPTESTTFATFHEIDQAREGTPVPIGLPIANTRVHLLDAAGQPVDLEVPGELWIGGDGLALGYLGDDELTADRFRPDPFSEVPGDRLYRTGDRAVRRPDGTLVFLGRTDRQIKLRGYRIELREVEAELRRLPGVAAAAVTVEAARGGQLVGVVTPLEDASPTPAGLRAALAERLPSYMVPGRVVVVPELPLTSGGKLDRARLPLQTERTGPAGPQPSTEQERHAVRLVAEVLGVDEVGLEENFFALGGHSLLVVELLFRVEKELGVRPSLEAFSRAPTAATLAAQLSGRSRSAAPIPRRGDAPPVPSFGQESLWFLQRLFPGSPLYNVVLEFRVEGALDERALRDSLAYLVERHPVLRTSLGEERGRCQPLVHQEIPDVLEVVEADEAELQARARVLFDLARPAKLRATLAPLGEGEHALQLVFHHAATDGWSLGVFLEELGVAYASFRGGEPPDLPPPPVAFTDFAHWQRANRDRRETESLLEEWREALEGAPTEHGLPARPEAGPNPERAGDHLLFSLEEPLVGAVRALAREEKTTGFTVLLAAFQALVARWSGRDDFLLGVPFPGRPHPETRDLVGFFENTLPLRADLRSDPSFRELVRACTGRVLETLAREELPIEELAREILPAGASVFNPLYQLVFQVLEGRRVVPRLDLPGLTTRRVPTRTGTAKFDLFLSVYLEGERAECELEFDTELFERETMEVFVDQFRRLLATATEDPSLRVGEIPLLSADQRRRQLVDWNRTTRDYPREATLAECFERVARSYPGRVAVAGEEQQLTYHALRARAWGLADALVAAGAGAGTLVALGAPSTVDSIVAMVAVVLAGAAYVPLDPAHPEARLREILEDIDARILLADPALAKRLGGSGITVIDPANVGPAPDGLRDLPAVSAEEPVYVIYTSGSTGRPKGVVTHHRGVLRLFHDPDFVRFRPGDVVAQISNLAFDPSVFEIWGALLGGARLQMVPRELLLEPHQLIEFLRGRGVTTLCLASSLFHSLVRAVPDALASIETFLVGFEPLSPSLTARALRHGAPDRFLHIYGPTEITFICSYAEVDTVPGGTRRLSIGHPLANDRLYVLDGRGQPVPPGVPGELYIGGDGVAIGYWDRPEITDRSFLPDPHAGRRGARMYRSGDRVLQRPDGCLEFLGRVDHQVKLRGHRVELEEIEARLSEIPGVQSAAVRAWGEDERRRLVGYLVAPDGGEELISRVRGALGEILPAYMIPGQLVLLPELPRNRNGKLDRARLPPPPDPGGDQVPARTPLERSLLRCFGELLGHPVGLHQDFFLAGGSSLLVVELLSRVEEEHGLRVAVAAFMGRSTPAGLATLLEQLRAGHPGDAPELLAPADLEERISRIRRIVSGWPGVRARPDALVLGHNVDGAGRPLFWCLQGEAELLTLARLMGPETPVYGMRSGHEIFRGMKATVPALSRLYADEILAIDPHGPFVIGGNCQGGWIAFDVARELQRRGQEVELLLQLETVIFRPFPGRVALMYGRESEQFNPYLKGLSPDARFRECYDEYTVDEVPGNHGQYFRPPNDVPFVATIQRRMAELPPRSTG